MSNNAKRVLARSTARELTAEERELVTGGDKPVYTTSPGSTAGGADHPIVTDDVTVS